VSRRRLIALAFWLAAASLAGGVVGELVAGNILVGAIAGFAAGIGVPLWIELTAADARIFQDRTQVCDEMKRRQFWSGAQWFDGDSGW
jgi:hypothetical protein